MDIEYATLGASAASNAGASEGTEVRLVDREVQRLPDWVLHKFALSAETLDLSWNSITTLVGLDALVRLRHLILDNNSLRDPFVIEACSGPFLETLSINKNLFDDLKSLIEAIRQAFPRIRHLSVLGNPCCPDQLTHPREVDGDDYARYRLYVISQLSFLEFLDCTEVTIQERKKARQIGRYQIVARPHLGRYRPPAEDQIPRGLHSLPHQNDDTDGSSDERNTNDTGRDQGQQSSQRRSAFGTRRYQYVGNHSEGNRFIRDKQL
ncbi:leucine-rich melanocyte differentiation-associated protein-like [Varroa jacobsoni]|uniref:Leucine-rich melanocyte differentiation-associated protein n=1 Tax=Varroa destructor TaxID=109461 RepID=A0A7M7JZQ9_VARDE|nr:leucine-rich melanocyte differentiation-associated protein-like [Varroa destructor]XP_022653423.1 leucine-rich melanocyte differentiation-associated protein-like [Varroa destructor]XP_022711456.1 leucine-rich melanocyte differentiation-associated protein-like [Varroa jacobsoni]XP_022711457.1 leucine-rich melanocyte differentiation-associated protein-like [Varroa jacobsoni]XP_022711458.1 leucine-rich melanocyte differentiation-associated protein-like [Varroa jacobsoni]